MGRTRFPARTTPALSNVGSFVNLRGGHVYPEKVLAAEKKPIRVYLCDGRNDNRGPPQRQIRRDAGLVLPERAADEGPHAEGLRRELLVGDEQSRAEVWRGDPAGHDAVAVAGRSGVHRPEGRRGAGVQPAGREEELGVFFFVRVPPQGQVPISEAIERLVQLYEALDKMDEGAKWRKELEGTEKPRDGFQEVNLAT